MSSSTGTVSYYIGKAWVILAAAAALAAGAVVAPVVTGGSGVSCDQTISSGGTTGRATLQTALTTASNGGKTICVTASISGADIITSTDMTGTVPVRVLAQPNDMTISMVTLQLSGANDITIEGFNFNNTYIDNLGDGTGQITIKKNYFHDIAGKPAIRVAGDTGSIADLSVIGNHFYRISCTASLTDVAGLCASQPAGYALYTAGNLTSAATNLVVSYNTVEVGGNSSEIVKSADGMELSGLNGFTIDHNIFKNIRWCGEIPGANCTDDGHEPHTDTLGLFSSSDNGTVSDNRLVDGPDFGITSNSNNITFTNNLIVELTHAQGCVDESFTSSGGTNPTNWTLTQNTIWTCGSTGLRFGASGGGSGNVADRNIVEGYSDCNASAWTDSNHSNALGQATKTCWPGASNTTSYVPTWGSTGSANWDNSNFYIPTNRPASDVGYSYVAAGYTNCGC